LNTLLVAATCAFLFLAPFAGSAGLRAGTLFLAAALLVARPSALRDALSRFPRPVMAACAAWAAIAIASLAWSVQPRFTLGELRAELLYGALALLVFYAAAVQDAARWRPWRIAILGGSAVVLAGLVVQLLLPFALTRHSVIEQRGPWSTHLVLLAPLLLTLGWPRPWGDGYGPRVQAAALAVLLCAAWESENRIMWIAIGVQLLMAMALSRATHPMEPSHQRDMKRFAIAAVVVVAVAFAASVMERNERFFGAGAPMVTSLERDQRPRIWRTAVEAASEAPWLGYGFGREIVAPRFIPLTPQVPNHPELRHAHNVFLDVVLETGLAGLAIFASMMLMLVREYRGYLRRPDLAPLGILGLTLVAGFLVKNLTDDFMHRHNALVFWALNGMLLGLGSGVPRAGAGSGAEKS
jgi:O-antigen ligase